jgi:ribosomal protein L37E
MGEGVNASFAFFMWVKRTEQEILEAKAKAGRHRIPSAVVVGFIFGLVVTFFRGGDWMFHNTSPFVSVEEFPGRLPFSIFAGISAGLACYFLANKRQTTVVCPECGKTKFQDSQPDCDCGGHFENIKTMKWVK